MKKLHNLLPNPEHQLILLVMVMLLMNCVVSIFADPPATQPPRPVTTTGSQTLWGTYDVAGSLQASGQWSPGAALPNNDVVLTQKLQNLLRGHQMVSTICWGVSTSGGSQVTGSGFVTPVGGDSGPTIQTGTTANSTAAAYGNAANLSLARIGQRGDKIDWSAPTSMVFRLAFASAMPSTGSIEAGTGFSGASSGIVDIGLGVLIEYSTATTATVKLRTYNGSLHTSSALATIAMNNTNAHEFLIVSDGAGNAYLYVDGTLAGSVANAPTAPNTNTVYPSILVKNGATAANVNITVSPLTITQL